MTKKEGKNYDWKNHCTKPSIDIAGCLFPKLQSITIIAKSFKFCENIGDFVDHINL